MNSSAGRASRKWPSGGLGRAEAAMVTIAAVLWSCWLQASRLLRGGLILFDPGTSCSAEHRAPARRPALPSVPLPRPRPAGAAQPSPKSPQRNRRLPGTTRPARGRPRAAAAASACRLALSDQVAIAPSIPDIHGPGGCGGEDLVRLEAVVLPDKHLVSVKPAATLRCTMALAVADWVRTDMAPLAQRLGSVLSDLDNLDSYECRGRNRVAGAKLSEHGLANALDVRALKLANGRSIVLTDRTVPREFRESVLHSVCARFSTVLGPGSDWYHEEHIHLDLMQRHNNYKICQWNIWDPLPQIAPLLPAERPDEAPPREVASQSGAARSEPAGPASGARSGPTPAASRQQKSAGEPALLQALPIGGPGYCINGPPPCSAICELNGESP